LISAQQLQYQWQVFLLAVGFLTRMPVPADPDFSDAKLNAASRYFPLVGLLLALLSALVFVLAAIVFEDVLIAVLLSMVASILLTGAFHEDGLADSCDGFGGGMQSQDVLRIMKDSRIGTYGSVALISVLALKATSLATMPSALMVVSALFWAHVVSRWLATSFLIDLDYVSGEGKSKPLATTMTLRDWLLSGLAILPVMLFCSWPAFFTLLFALLVFRFGFARYLRRRIGGYTGDALGAAQQIAEVIIYLVFLI
jgi:adenosylcobinamide-GDP ribazoletransferase